MILNICDDPNVLSVMRIIKISITLIKIIVPIILIISGMIIFLRSVISADTTNALSIFVKKAIAAVLIFFIPTLVSILINIVGVNVEYRNCLNNATSKGITNAYINRANNLLISAKNTLDYGYYLLAENEISKLKDENTKNKLQEELKEIKDEIDNAKEERKKVTTGVLPDGKYTKTQVIDMTEQQVKDMTNEEFIEFIASAARIVYSEYGGVLPSITVAQAILESGYGNSFINTTYNVYGLQGYPSNKKKVNGGGSFLRQFENFYDSTYYHYAYFQEYSKVYDLFLRDCNNKDAISASQYLYKYANGSTTYAPNIEFLINKHDLTRFDY